MMKPIAVEAREKFRHGFVLTEGEFRRLVDLLREQAKKVRAFENLKEKFIIKFLNGVVAEADSIDAILQQENSGSALIVRVRYELTSGEESAAPLFCAFEFINADYDDEPGYTSVKFSVRATDRDWVFVTSSQLRERIEKVRRFAPNQIGLKGAARFLVPVLTPFIVIAIFLGYLTYRFESAMNETIKAHSYASELKRMVDEGKIRDPIQAIIKLEEIRENSFRGRKVIMIPPFVPLGYSLGAIAILILLSIVFTRYYPVYNFCWGDYIDTFQRREHARYFWLVIIGVGLIVSFGGGMLANRFK